MKEALPLSVQNEMLATICIIQKASLMHLNLKR